MKIHFYELWCPTANVVTQAVISVDNAVCILQLHPLTSVIPPLVL